MLLCLLLAATVVQDVEHGRVDWTRGRLLVEASGGQNTGAWTDPKLVEQTALSQLELRMTQAALDVPFDEGRRAGDLAEDPLLSAGLEEGLAGWTIDETRYYGSGRVELRAELDLHDWLRPALVAQAKGDPDAPSEVTSLTGVVVDARGLGATPSLCPVLLAPGRQDVLYGLASLTPEVAAQRLPVVWVSDPSDPVAIERAGSAPAFVDVEALRGSSELILREDDAAQLRTLAANTDLLRQGRVVVVVDP